MRRLFIILFALTAGVSLVAQPTRRDSVLAEARYLKSIYRTDEAIEKLSSLVSPETFDEQVFSELADCHFQSGDYETAAGTYFLLSSRKPDNILYKIRQMQIYSRLKAWPRCIQAGQEVLQLDSIPAVLSMIGDSFRQLNEADSALVYYRESLARRLMNETVISKIMGILIDTEDYDGAIAQGEQYLSEDPDNLVIAPLVGLSYYRKGDHENAIKVFQRQLDIGNDSYPIHYYLGLSYWQTKVIYRAEEELVAAWQFDSTDVNLAYSIAAVKAEAFRSFEKSVKPWLDRALEMIQPDSLAVSRLHQQYGLGYYKLQESWDQAIGHYKEAYRYNPKFISALSTIAYCYEQKKDYEQALAWYEKYLKVARPGSKGYNFAKESVMHLRAELFMDKP